MWWSMQTLQISDHPILTSCWQPMPKPLHPSKLWKLTQRSIINCMCIPIQKSNKISTVHIIIQETTVPRSSLTSSIINGADRQHKIQPQKQRVMKHCACKLETQYAEPCNCRNKHGSWYVRKNHHMLCQNAQNSKMSAPDQNNAKFPGPDKMAKTCTTARVSKCAKLKNECAKPRQDHRCHRTLPKHVQPQRWSNNDWISQIFIKIWKKNKENRKTSPMKKRWMFEGWICPQSKKMIPAAREMIPAWYPHDTRMIPARYPRGLKIPP